MTLLRGLAMLLRARARSILSMPPEPLEIVAGIGGVLWALCYSRVPIDPDNPTLRGYADLSHLPMPIQLIVLAIAAGGGSMQVLVATWNDARLRYIVDVAMLVFFVLVAVHVYLRIGITPVMAMYLTIILANVMSPLMLLRSGHVRA